MIQDKTLDGEDLDYGRLVDDIVENVIAEGIDEGLIEKLPAGIVGINLDDGLVEVLTKVNEINPYISEDITVKSVRKAYMKFGKLLRKAGESEHTSRILSGKLSAIVKRYKGSKLLLANTEDDIYEVYKNGPRSCMSGSDSVRVYGGPDTAVGYVIVEGRVVARSVLNTIKKEYTSIYGNRDLLKPLLESNGYSEGCLSGCRLSRIEHNYEILAPYLDRNDCIDDDGSYLIVRDCGEYCAKSTSGYLHINSCNICGVSLHNDDGCWSDHYEADLCETCHSETHVYIDGDNYHIEDPDIVALSCGNYVHVDNAVYSEYHDCYLNADDAIYIEDREDYVEDDQTYAVWCEVGDKYQLKEDCSYLVQDDVYVHDDHIIRVITGYKDGEYIDGYSAEIYTTTLEDGKVVHNSLTEILGKQEVMFNENGDVINPEPGFTTPSYSVFNFAQWKAGISH